MKDLIKYCKEKGYENPKIWPASCTMDYAVSLHMMSDKRWEEYDANILFVIGGHCKDEDKLLRLIVEKFQEPVVLTVPRAVSQQNYLTSIGFSLIPARWADTNEREYEVYVKGLMNIGGFANLMENVESISSYVVSIKRPFLVILLSFIAFKISKVFSKALLWTR